MKTRLTGCLLGVSLSVALAQDPQFSQILTDPLYHNPALIGGANQPRVVLHSRWQWPGLGMGYRSHTASFDDFFELGDYGFGYGAQALRDDQGRGTSTTGIGLGLSGRKELSEALTLSAGAQFRFFNTRYHSDYTHVDQFVSGTFVPVSNDPLAQNIPPPLNYRDISIGGMAEYLREAFNVNSLGVQVGLAGHHLGHRRDENRDGPLNFRFSAHVAARFPLFPSGDKSEEKTVLLTTYFRNQGPNWQLDAIGGLRYEAMEVGLGYRGIPLRRQANSVQRDALVATVGFVQPRYRLMFTYDLTISGLHSATLGSYELTLWLAPGRFGELRGSLPGGRRRSACPNSNRYYLYL